MKTEMGWGPRLLRGLYRRYPLKRGRERLFGYAMRKMHGFALEKDTFGNTLLLDLDSMISSFIFLKGAYEPEQIAFFLKEAEQFGASIFLDIGANLGIYTLAFARNPRFQKICSFEPDPRNRTLLQTNLLLNSLSEGVTVHDCALANTDGMAEFKLERTAYEGLWGKTNAGTSRFSEPDETPNPFLQVPIKRLDSLYPLKGETIAIKIDVEGFEKTVLEGMADTLRNNRCLLLIEIFEPAFKAVDALLADAGYKSFEHKLEGDNYLYRPAG